MDFSSTTTTSEKDWRQWATRNVSVSDGGLSLSRKISVRGTTIGDAVLDIAIDPTGMLYTLSPSGALAQYDPVTESRRSLIDGHADSLSTPCAVCASRSTVYVTEGPNRLKKISPQRRRVTEQQQAATATPVATAYNRGSLYTLDAGGHIVETGPDEEPLDWSLRSPIDMDVTDAGIYVLDAVDGEVVVRVHSPSQPEATLSLPAAASFHIDQTPFVPTALTVLDERLLIAGTETDSDRAGLFEWCPKDERFRRLTTLAGRCHKLVGHTGRKGLRTLYAVVGADRTCQALTEVTEHVRHPRTQNHVGFAVSQYDAGSASIEWHRLAFTLAQSAANTQVRVWYRAADDPCLLRSGVEADSNTATSSPNTATNEGQQAVLESLFAPETCRTLASHGITSVQALLTADEHAIADGDRAITAETLSSWQETAFDALEAQLESDWTVVTDPASHDILLERAVGRYLNVALEFRGTPTTSPRVSSLTAYCPRQTYLRYLPELYQQDNESAAFLEQFLSVFETSFTDIQSDIEHMTQYFDPAGTPSESLGWLEGWLAADEYRDWPESARRERLARARELYMMRGTRAGLRELIELYLRHATDGEVTAGEHGDDQVKTDADGQSVNGDTPTGHRLFFVDRSDLDGVDSTGEDTQFGSLLAHDRSVILFCGPFESSAHEEAIRTIVETEKPAHVDVTVRTLEEGCSLGTETFLGLNAELGTESFSLGDGTLGRDTYLSDRLPTD